MTDKPPRSRRDPAQLRCQLRGVGKDRCATLASFRVPRSVRYQHTSRVIPPPVGGAECTELPMSPHGMARLGECPRKADVPTTSSAPSTDGGAATCESRPRTPAGPHQCEHDSLDLENPPKSHKTTIRRSGDRTSAIGGIAFHRKRCSLRVRARPLPLPPSPVEGARAWWWGARAFRGEAPRPLTDVGASACKRQPAPASRCRRQRRAPRHTFGGAASVWRAIMPLYGRSRTMPRTVRVESGASSSRRVIIDVQRRDLARVLGQPIA